MNLEKLARKLEPVVNPKGHVWPEEEHYEFSRNEEEGPDTLELVKFIRNTNLIRLLNLKRGQTNIIKILTE